MISWPLPVFTSTIRRIFFTHLSIAGRLGVTGAVREVCFWVIYKPFTHFIYHQYHFKIVFSFLHEHTLVSPFLFAYRAEFFFSCFHVIIVKANIPSSSKVFQYGVYQLARVFLLFLVLPFHDYTLKMISLRWLQISSCLHNFHHWSLTLLVVFWTALYLHIAHNMSHLHVCSPWFWYCTISASALSNLTSCKFLFSSYSPLHCIDLDGP